MLATVVLVACGGGDADPCQEEDDCASGLMCCNKPSDGLSTRGECRAASECVDTSRDAGPPVDGGPDSGPRDAGPILCDPNLVLDGGGVLDGGAVRPRCPMGFFCNGDVCTGEGFCDRVPDSCEGDVEQVCGCDGRTFLNACEAAQSTTRIQSAGECGATPIDAGTDAGADAGADAGPTDAGPTDAGTDAGLLPDTGIAT